VASNKNLKIMATDILTNYTNCIEEFVSKIVNTFDDNLRVIILHGGLVRDPSPIARWSDIDLIVVFGQYSSHITAPISELAEYLETKNDLRLDINLIYESDFANDYMRAKYYNSEIINALNQRGTKILYGSFSGENVALFNEREAVYVYLNTVQNLFRRYYLENIYRDKERVKNPAYMQRIIRWVFSIIRSSLRLKGIFANPYQESLNELIRLNIVSSEEIELLKRLMEIRNNFDSFGYISEDHLKELYTSVECFVEKYIHEVIHHWQVIDRS
jgi:predicted nucleotidyltransferase/uncharacterized protein YutE (UPF0331/DUF86 family)